MGGPAATVTAHLEGVAEAGEIVVSPSTAGLLDSRSIGDPKADGLLIAAPPRRTLETEVTRAVALGRPSLSLPSVLSDHLVAAPVENEHRQAAVAFIEFSGVDDLLERSGSAVCRRCP